MRDSMAARFAAHFVMKGWTGRDCWRENGVMLAAFLPNEGRYPALAEVGHYWFQLSLVRRVLKRVVIDFEGFGRAEVPPRLGWTDGIGWERKDRFSWTEDPPSPPLPSSGT